MNFSIRHAEESDLCLVNITDESTGTTVALLPGAGALLHAFRIRQRDGSLFNVIDNYRNNDELKADIGRSFKGPKLSPFPCRIPEGVYHIGEKSYRFGHLFSDGTAIHGLLYDRPFAIVEETAGDNGGAVLMEYPYRKDDPGYPFQYDCQVRYTLRTAGELEVVTTVTNLDETVIPMADGWHPYFRLGGRVDDWQMQFYSSAIVDFDERLVPTGHLSPYGEFEKARLIGDTFLDNCFTLKPAIVSASCELFNPSNGLRVSFFPEASYLYLQVYTPHSRESIAIENLSAAPDCFNNGLGLLWLQPGHSQIFTVLYKVSVD
ncbi:MAG TPA: aldose 1-epimerase [Puia sp.]|jgi:aldose 1-epimerase|nr:aldose 1-epimerase [Puia sp.]